MAISHDRLPRNIEAEKAALGAILTSHTVKDQALAELQESDFFLDIHQKIFSAVVSLNNKNIKVDIQTITQELKNQKALEQIGGVDYLFELTQSMLLPENANEYIAMIKDNSNLRQLFLAIEQIENRYLHEKMENMTQFVAEAQKAVDSVAEKRRISNFKSSPEVADVLQQKIYALSESYHEGDLTGVDTGFRDLNNYTNGFQDENLIIVAGRTGLGKTAFALNLLLNAAKTGVPVGIFEMEMPSYVLFMRLLAREADVKLQNLQHGKINPNEFDKIKTAINHLKELKIYVDDSSSLTIYDLVAKARKLKTEQPDLKLLVIDYLGIISRDAKRSKQNFDSRTLEIAQYTRTIHELARELKIPIVLLCQLNRKVEDREGGTPRLSDLRESGSIEQDAEIVLLLHSKDYGKNSLTEEAEKARKKITAANMDAEARSNLENAAILRTMNENDGKPNQDKSRIVMDVIVAKNRNGVSDRVVKLIFEKDYCRFTDVTRDFLQREENLKSSYHN